MAARTATKSGNWSDVSVWDGGASLPGSGDTADSNGYTVAIDQDIEVATLINTNAGAGWFTVPDTLNGTRAIVASVTSSVRQVLRCSNTGANIVSITGTITANGAMSAVLLLGTGIMNITAAGGISNNSTDNAVYNNTTGTINITGNLTGGTNQSTNTGAVYNNSTGTINITGNVTGGTGNYGFGANNQSTGTITVSATATGGSGAYSRGLSNESTGIASCNEAVGGTGRFAAGIHGQVSGGTTTFVKSTAGANGLTAISGWVKMLESSTVNKATFKRSSDGADSYLSNDYPAITDVKKDTVYKLTTLTGTYDPTAAAIYPVAADVLDTDVAYGPTGADYAGTYHAPAVSEVIDSASFGAASAETGTVHLPDAGEVIDTAVFGAASAVAGTFAVPAEADVELGVTYGADGTQYTGTLAGGGGGGPVVGSRIVRGLGAV